MQFIHRGKSWNRPACRTSRFPPGTPVLDMLLLPSIMVWVVKVVAGGNLPARLVPVPVKRQGHVERLLARADPRRAICQPLLRSHRLYMLLLQLFQRPTPFSAPPGGRVSRRMSRANSLFLRNALQNSQCLNDDHFLPGAYLQKPFCAQHILCRGLHSTGPVAIAVIRTPSCVGAIGWREVAAPGPRQRAGSSVEVRHRLDAQKLKFTSRTSKSAVFSGWVLDNDDDTTEGHRGRQAGRFF